MKYLSMHPGVSLTRMLFPPGSQTHNGYMVQCTSRLAMVPTSQPWVLPAESVFDCLHAPGESYMPVIDPTKEQDGMRIQVGYNHKCGQITGME